MAVDQRIVVALIGALFFALDARAEPSTFAAKKDADFVLAPGQSASFAGPPPVTFRFVRVAEDGRCPRGKSCTATLPVTLDIEIAQSGLIRTERLAIMNRDVGEPQLKGLHSCAQVGKLVLRLRDVKPWPVENEKTTPSQYRATFILEPTCGKPR